MFHLQSGWASFILDKGRWDDGVGERERETQRKKWREQQRAVNSLLGNTKGHNKLVHFLINNTRLKKSFENRENLKL